MIYSPILIPTLCRSEHFIRCIESLKKNSWAKYTQVYIALDYPAKDTHWKGYNKILEYLNGDFSEFAGMHILKRTHNYGAHDNVVEARNDILKKYDRFIYTDDDCEFSINFLEYMNLCLDKYENDKDVLGIAGYSYPVKWDIGEQYNAFKNSLIFPMWGTGFWRDKFEEMLTDLKKDYIGEYVRSNMISRKYMTDARYLDCLCFATNYNAILNKSATDVACGCYIQLTKKFVITPTVSLVRNYGFDGSGEWCQNTALKKNEECTALDYAYQDQIISEKSDYMLNVCENYNFESNKKILDAFDNREDKIIKKCERKLKFQKIIGSKLYRILWEKKNRKHAKRKCN